MPTFLLTDITREVRVDPFEADASALGLPAAAGVRIVKRTLRGGRREGVEVIEVDNGALAFTLLPTRGMGIAHARLGEDRVGWDSPVSDGPIHPSFVNLEAWGGLGWLDGFDELLARCGLETNGPPHHEGDRTYTLHGRIANLPAHRVEVRVAESPPHAIVVAGQVDESRLFGPRFRLVTTITTIPGSNRLVVRDEVRNLKDQPASLSLLYHWNFGPPHLGPGSRFVAPLKTLAPRTPEAASALERFDVYEAPTPGFSEQVYFCELHGEGVNGRTLAMLRNAAGDKAVVLRFATAELPVFTLWKNTGGLRDGYVTGLEPGVNLPNPRPFERSRGRLPTIPPGGLYVAETSLEVLASADDVNRVEAEAAAIQSRGPLKTYRVPDEPFAPIA